MYKQAGIYTLKEIVLEYVGKYWKKTPQNMPILTIVRISTSIQL